MPIPPAVYTHQQILHPQQLEKRLCILSAPECSCCRKRMGHLCWRLKSDAWLACIHVVLHRLFAHTSHTRERHGDRQGWQDNKDVCPHVLIGIIIMGHEHVLSDGHHHKESFDKQDVCLSLCVWVRGWVGGWVGAVWCPKQFEIVFFGKHTSLSDSSVCTSNVWLLCVLFSWGGGHLRRAVAFF